MSEIESKRIFDEVTTFANQPGGMTAGVCGSAGAGVILVAEISGCTVLDSEGFWVLEFDGVGVGTLSLSANAGGFASKGSVKRLLGWGVCFGASIPVGSGTLCGSISYNSDDGLWHATGAYSLYIGIGADVGPGLEAHMIYGETHASQIFDYSWLKFWEWNLW